MPSLEQIGRDLLAAGYLSADQLTFTHPLNRRVVSVEETGTEVELWEECVGRLLQREQLRAADAWSRYVVLIIRAAPSLALCRAAAAFAQRVDRCRRVAIFAEALGGSRQVLPFLALGGAGIGIDVPSFDVASLVRSSPLCGVTASALLDDTVPLTTLEQTALEHEP
jgi:hypothetical protein